MAGGFTPAVPICADESVHVAADLDTIARRYQAVNVKLDKAGGLTAALELAHAARERGLGPDDGMHGELVALDRARAARCAHVGLRRP
jgi:L-alanine-DL-glutamate epimerase-like enolase superfamily enzyme